MAEVDGPEALRVVACPRPFSTARLERVVPHGQTLAEILNAVGVTPGAHVHVFLDDDRLLVDSAWWPRIRPRAGARVTVRVVPAGGRRGGGGGGGKDATRIVLTIAVAALAVAAPYLAPASWGLVAGGSLTFAGALVSGGIGVVGAVRANALVPPPPHARGRR